MKGVCLIVGTLSLSLMHGWGAGSSSLADVEERRGEVP